MLITYPGQPGKQTAFTYDGLGRRRTITSTPPGGGSAAMTAYLWCGDDICQSRDGSNTPTRSYYDEGEYVPGTPAQTLYYGIDQIGSVRRVFESAAGAPAYGYDPLGAPLQATAPITDFVYAGMFYNADSGLYLTKHRVYDSTAGRWLTRDPIGERSDPLANLYAYVGGNPISVTDTSGLGFGRPRPPGCFGAGSGIAVAPVADDPKDPKYSDDDIRILRGFSGSRRNQLQSPPGRPRNDPMMLGNRLYSGHALDQMQNRGIPYSVVEQAIREGIPLPGNEPGTTQYYDPTSHVSVIVDDATGNVITIRYGK